MSEFFTPLTQPYDDEYRQQLMDKGTMPAALVCITDQRTGDIYSVDSKYGLHGLPNYDLAAMDPDETPEHYASFRLSRRFQCFVPEDSLEFIPQTSTLTPYQESIGNKHHDDKHYRQYVPIVGTIDAPITNPRLVLAAPDLIIESLEKNWRRTPVRRHLLDLHRELFERFVQ